MIIKVDNKNIFTEDVADDEAYNNLVKEMKSSDCFIRLSDLCDKFGYKLFWATKDESDYIDIRIRPAIKYISNIYINNKFINNKPTIVAETTNFGRLSVEQYSEFCDAVNKTNELLKKLQEFDYSDIMII